MQKRKTTKQNAPAMPWWFVVIGFYATKDSTDAKTYTRVFRVTHANSASCAMRKVRAYIADKQEALENFHDGKRALDYTHVAIIEGGRFDCGDAYIAIEEMEIDG